MKVFFIVFLFGSPAATVGPVERPACEAHLANESARMDAFYRDPAKVANLRKLTGKDYTRGSVAFACSENRPFIKDAVKP